MGKVTLQTIADHVGVSRMTVSNAFSKPDQLSESLRQRILAAAEELGYAGPDPAARALARGSTGAVGVLLTDSLRYAFDDEVATSFLGAIADELAPTGLALTLLSAVERGGVNPARDVAMDGAMVYSCAPGSPALAWLHRRKLPLVYVDQVPVEDIPSVNVDDRGGARAAAQHLVDLGHRRFGLIDLGKVGGVSGTFDAGRVPELRPGVSHDRLRGWLDALTPSGAEVSVVVQTHFDPEASYASARTLLEREARPTALLCYADVVAVAAVHAAEDLGLRVPEDLSVVGFDDSPAASRLRPALTTVRQDVAEKGRAAAGALTAAIRAAAAGDGRPPVRHLVLPTELVVRDSTAPPPS